MATLVRARARPPALAADIPTPFPTHLVDAHDDVLHQLAVEPVDYDDSSASRQDDIRASVAAVRDSCLTTLAGVVAVHAPLARLVHALRNGDRDDPLFAQLQPLVDAAAPELDKDAPLAQAIVSLLIDLEQLPASLALAPQLVPQSDPFADSEAAQSPYASMVSLQRQLSSLQPPVASGPRPTPAENIRTALLCARIDDQLETVVSLCRARTSSSPLPPDDALPPEYDAEYDEYPPSYVADAFAEDSPSDEKGLLDQYPPEKLSPHPSTSGFSSRSAERARHSNSLDIERITHAIDRLYAAAPQLANQRVELRTDKIVEMEEAKVAKGKARTRADAADPELDKMLDLLGRASAREIPDQSVVLHPRRDSREKIAVNIEEQRSKYLEHLLHRTHAGRLHSQDAVPSLSRSYSSPSSAGAGLRDEEESADACHEQRTSREGKRASYHAVPKPGAALELPSERSRNRSLSASHLGWLRSKDKPASTVGAREGFGSAIKSLSSESKSLSSSVASRSVRSLSGRLRGGSKARSPSAGGDDVNHGALDVAYVAEHHETLKHVLLFIAYVSPSSSTPGGVPLAEVLPSTSSGKYGDSLFLRLGNTPSPPLALPVPVVPGSKTVLSRGSHWEVKAGCYQTGNPPKETEDVSLLPASELASLSPSSYVCSSCSLPLVPTPPTWYRDLPSEHWEELIDAWMCHPEEQTLAKPGMHGSDGKGKGNDFGFWPASDEALVGGSYVLFDAEVVASGNIRCVGGERGGNTRLARCLCGAVLGRLHDRRLDDGSVSRMYRLFKYAIRPVSATSQAPKIPMSAFVLHDMQEHVQAHATYRFVLSDEEEEKPRILIWLFKPRIRISYMLPASALLPKSDTISASKVLYKILGPTSAATDLQELLNRYPGFPQAEFLFYPMDVCRQLAALLKESTRSYPESLRTMTGLDVGWLTMTA